MDPELIAYLDRRFNELRAELGTAITTSAQETRRYVDTAITASAEETRQHVDVVAAETRRHADTVASDSRRHFDVTAERLMDKIQLVGEGVIGINQKVDRLATEMRAEFQKVDRRFLHLQARVIEGP